MLKPTSFYLVLWIYAWQIVSAVIIFLILLAFNYFFSLSFILGAAAILLGNGFLTHRVYQKYKSLKATSMLSGFLSGALGKYCIFVLSTVMIAKYVTINWLFYLLGVALPQVLGVIFFVIVSGHKHSDTYGTTHGQL